MKVLFFTHYFNPHIGGVEKHVERLSQSLIKKRHEITIVTKKYDSNLKNIEEFNGIKIIRFPYPHKKFSGLIDIWRWLWVNRELIKQSDIVHCHDIFIWYLPFRLIYPFKKIFTTFHGWEGIFPIPFNNIFQKRIANLFSTKTIAVGKYIEKYYGIKTNKIIYGGVDSDIKPQPKSAKSKYYLVYLGRLEKDTGLTDFFKWLNENKKYQVDFIGEGSLREECLKYGRVLGFIDPAPFLEKAEVCVPGGYLSYIEARSYGCKTITFPNNKLKEDYWRDIERIKKFPSWDKLADEYISLYNSSK